MFHMATVTRTYTIDDLDNSTEDVENVQFSLDGHHLEIDLSAANAARLREKLERFIEAGHQVKKQKRGIRKQVITTGAVSKEHTQAIRHWAKENGYQVSGRGRVPSTVRDAFEAAHRAHTISTVTPGRLGAMTIRVVCAAAHGRNR